MDLTFVRIQEGGSSSALRISARANVTEVLSEKGANVLHVWVQRALADPLRAAGKFTLALKVLTRVSLGEVLAADQVVLEPVEGQAVLWPATSNPNTQVLYVPRTSEVKVGDVLNCLIEL